MGTCAFERINNNNRYKKNDFQLIKMIGKGSFGKVWKVQHKLTHHIYALKIMEKTRIIATKSVKAVICQKSILSSLSEDKTRFIINMEAAFQDTNKLYLLMNFIQGKNLRHYLNQKLTFAEKQIKFLAINILKALSYLHKKRILHRDLKPENIIIDEKGFPHLTDFGIAQFYKIENSQQNGGTLSYMAPEVLSSQNHNYAVDYYALGVIIYELFFGKRPFQGQEKCSLIKLIMKGQLNFKNQKTPLSNQAKDFLTKLLQKKQKNRIGYNSISQIFDHPWLNDDCLQSCHWSKEKQQIFNQNCDIIEDSQCKLNEHKNVDTNSDFDNSILSNLLDRPHIQQLFQAFDFIPLQNEENKKQLKIQNMDYGNPESNYSLSRFLKK